MPTANFLDYSPIVVPNYLLTSFEEFLDWMHSGNFPEHGKISYIGGNLVIDLNPECADTHNFVRGEIQAVMYNLIKHSNLGRWLGRGIRVTNTEALLATEPDASFVSWQCLSRSKLVTHEPPSQHFSELIGTPEWVLEVVSPSSKKVDAIDLKDRYFEAGIREYWLVDALEDEIDFSVFIPGNQGYKHASQQEDWRFSPVFDRWFKLTRELDENQLWQYTLDMRIK